MRIEALPLAGAALIRLEPRADERGWFARSFCVRSLAAHGLHAEYPQHNISFNRRAGTLRGLHFQLSPHEEVKIISCTRGRIFDVLVDLRPGSATYGQWHGAELSAENHDRLYAPAGFAHGFQTLSDDAEVHYLMGCEYVDGAAAGIRHDDPTLSIPWPLPVSAISERDLALPTLTKALAR
ncbi:dTDP-4-dehydrorhamnose 3,5-epimerase [Sediminicoccus sp. KRV36]|uniref:dTDP-4-dehydrorhamnose 3,5-epimerase n=1 Tax=Sediminicoccus sp. KRV36 TaxID=3133721 RepID=UPI00200C5FC0|nr:dTDP-4-dehydrorhamnose 3,5-epimerase [Sediminicoccus rosea]UPY37436.1 dTDP-4-dehydrorhamnose 3,5-epimerase [Sediminicoccus rosea]UPY38170.1 dTDP-4-dehydrorhamnose 3,5-epimerase [Sediminicoccus rosea]